MVGFWICVVKVSQDFENGSGSKHARIRNMASLWICESYTGFWICLDKCKYSLVVPQSVLMRINNADYAWICVNIMDKQNSEHVRILNVSDAVQSHCTNHWAVIESKVYSE